jgi:quercetin dioxygenase-like cupin family protein
VSGVSVQILTLGIPGSRMLAYRVRFDAGARAEVGLHSRSTTGEVICMVWGGTIETDLGEGPVTLALGDAIHATFTRQHRLVWSGAEAADVILVSAHPIDFSAPR